MFVPAYNYLALCGKCAGKKLIVIRVIANRLSQALNRKNFRVGCDQIKDRSQHNRRKLLGKDFSHPSIFIENFL